MTPFGIRKRIKTALGIGPVARSIVAFPITFILPDGSERRVEAEERYSLLMASQALPSPISTGRRAGGTCPDGGCGLCRVEVLDQTGLTPMAELERNTMDAFVRGDPHEGRERSPGPPATPLSRLGCHARIVGPGARVKVDAMVDFESLKGEMNGS
jgi:ferredoxin